MMTEEEAAHLQKENQELREALEQAQALLRVALLRIEELEKLKTPPPAFVKANVKKPAKEEKKPRKKRAAQHNHGRPRAVPTQIVEHRLLTCPACALRLGGPSPRGHRYRAPATRGSDAPSHLQGLVFGLSAMA